MTPFATWRLFLLVTAAYHTCKWMLGFDLFWRDIATAILWTGVSAFVVSRGWVRP